MNSTVRTIRILEIRRIVAEHFSLRPADFTRKDRRRIVSWPRQYAVYLASKLTKLSNGQVGSYFGAADPSTVFYSQQAARARLAACPALAAEIAELEFEIRHSELFGRGNPIIPDSRIEPPETDVGRLLATLARAGYETGAPENRIGAENRAGQPIEFA